jgi:hypothetical protein
VCWKLMQHQYKKTHFRITSHLCNLYWSIFTTLVILFIHSRKFGRVRKFALENLSYILVLGQTILLNVSSKILFLFKWYHFFTNLVVLANFDSQFFFNSLEWQNKILRKFHLYFRSLVNTDMYLYSKISTSWKNCRILIYLVFQMKID